MHIDRNPLRLPWSLWRQILCAIGIVVISVHFAAGELIRRLETHFLASRIQAHTKQVSLLLSGASMDAIISKDRPILKTIVDQIGSSDPSILKFIVQDSDSEVLASWEREQPASDPNNLLSFQELVVFQGETFGRVDLTWDISNEHALIEEHVTTIQTFLGFVLVALGGAILVCVQFLVVRPIRQIEQRLANKNADEYANYRPGLLASKEVKNLHGAIDQFVNAERLKVGAEAASQAKSAVLAHMGHEIRTPLGGVLGSIELVLEGPLNEEQRESAEIVHSCTRNLLQMMNDLLDLSKIEAGKFVIGTEPFSLPEITRDLLGLLGPVAQKKGVKLTSSSTPDVPAWVEGGGPQLRQILMNLVGNALKFTSEGEVALNLSSAPLEAGMIQLNIAIKDSGIGIPPDRIEKIFEQFEQAESSTTRRFGGTGLGLSICRKLAGLMGGKVWAESDFGKGSVFHVQIPFKVGKVQQSDAAESEISVRPLKILVADDNMVNRKILKKLLESRGHQVEIVENGSLAVNAAKAGSFDIVLMDLHMPVMDGYTATQEIRASGLPVAQTPIIAVTASRAAGDEDRCIRLGMDACLDKPVDKKELFKALKKFTTPAS